MKTVNEILIIPLLKFKQMSNKILKFFIRLKYENFLKFKENFLKIDGIT